MIERTPGYSSKCALKTFEFFIARFDHIAGPMHAHDSWAAFERAEHDTDPTVLSNVSNGLDAAPGEIQVRDRPIIDDREGARETLRGHVDVSVGSQRRSRDEEHLFALR